jgi:cytochrome c oxidase subunit III
MEIGTVRTIPDEKKKKRLKTTSTGTSGSRGGRNRGGGGGNNGGGGGGDLPDNDFSEAPETASSKKLRVAMWFILLVVLMTFGGLIAAYVVVSTNGVLEWRPFDLPFQVWISTALIIASSVAYKISQRALNSNNQQLSKKWLLATTALGAAFISSQILLWLALVRRGVYVYSNPYAGFFYILTAVHAVHVVGGIIALGNVVLRTWNETSFDDELLERKNIARSVGWYWHFMDALWLALVLLLGFYK